MKKQFVRYVGFLFALLVFTYGAIVLFNYGKDDGDDAAKQYIKDNYKVFPPVLPDELYFAGEKVPLEYFDVRESLDYELLKIMYWHSETFLYFKRANRFFPVIVPILRKYGVPEDFKYLVIVESGLRNVVSPSKAAGYWQFMKSTAQDYGLEVNKQVDERYHIEKSTEAACKYLLDSYKKLNSWTLAAASYNVGRGSILNSMQWQKEDCYYDLLVNRETARYLYRILAMKLIFESPKDYGFNFRKKDLYKPIETETIKVDTSVSSFVDFAKHFGTNYKVLKILNPWLRDRKLDNKNHKTYYIKVPKQGSRKVKK